MLSKEELIELGFERERLGKAFKIIKGLKTREECLKALNNFNQGIKAERKDRIVPGSVLEFFIGIKFMPGTQQVFPASNNEKRRMLENKAITINGMKPGPDDPMIPRDCLWEIVFFEGSKSQCSFWWNENVLMELMLCLL
jgi:hypothetical protein